MNILNYLLYYFIILPIAYLPFRVLYFLSDVLFLVFFHLAGYRKKVVLRNIANSFPELSKEEHNRIASKFYRHFCDVMVETFKSFAITKEELLKRNKLTNPELINQYFEKGQSVILAGGHYNNWEWVATGMDHQVKHQVIAIYKALSNKFFDEKVLKSRSNFGLQMISTKRVAEVFDNNKNDLTATIFAIDQSPSNPRKAYWMQFLNQETACFYGTEKYARQYNMPVLFGSVKKVSRGHYEYSFSVVTENPASEEKGFITKKTNLILENDILQAPEFWLWTHKRWKHQRPEGIQMETVFE